MRYNKSPLIYSQQAQKLLDRRLIADKSILEKTLENINYYRLSGYYYHFLDKNDEFISHTTLTKILSIYNFDKQLRIVLFKYIELVEIGLRSKIVYSIAHSYGSFALDHKNNFPALLDREYEEMLNKIDTELKKSRELFIKHFCGKYKDSHKRPPIWMVIEVISFGVFIRMYSGLNTQLKKKISSQFNLIPRILNSWMWSINVLRNCIAHHSRIWNKPLSVKPEKLSAKHHKRFYTPYEVNNESLFGLICTIQYFYKYFCEENKLYEELKTLQYTFGLKLLHDCGFPENWEQSEIWKTK